MKTGKRVLSIFLVVLMLLTAAPLAGFVGIEVFPKVDAENLPTSGPCGDNVYWSYDNNTKTLSISGDGPMADYYFNGGSTNAPYRMYYGRIKSVIINTGVTSIGSDAFDMMVDSSVLKSVTISSTVTSIGSQAFSSCVALDSIIIPNSVKSIGENAFSECTSLTSITIPKSVTDIGQCAFRGCSGITQFKVDSGNPYYSSDSSGCLFNKGQDKLISYPVGNKRSYYSIPESVTTIDKSAFQDGSYLTSVSIPNSVTQIGEYAFSNSGLYLDESNWNNDVLYIDGCLIKTRGTISGSYTIKTGTRVIAANAFCDCDGISSVIIPDSVISIGENAFRDCSLNTVNIPKNVRSIEEGAFAATSLKSITVTSDNTSYKSDIFGCLYSRDMKILFQYPLGNEREVFEIPKGVTMVFRAFSECEFLSRIIMPDSVTIIGDGGFDWCINLTQINLSASLQSIGNGAFRNTALKELSIPKSVRIIGDGAFECCNQLEKIVVDTNNYSYSSDNRGVLFNKSKTNLLLYPAGNTAEKYVVPNCVRTISQAFNYCKYLRKVYIPNNVKSIAAYAFIMSEALEYVRLPEGLTSIKEGTFYACEKLNEVELPNSIETIGEHAFGGTAFTRFVFPKRIKTISRDLFYDCDFLESITLPKQLETIEEWAFYCCPLKTIYMPSLVRTVGSKAFVNNEEYYPDVYFEGSSEQWQQMEIVSDNEKLLNATIHFNVQMPWDSTFFMDNRKEVGIACEYEYRDSFFENSAFSYNHDLSIASCCLATAAMVNDSSSSYKEPDAARTMLSDLGFGQKEGETIWFSASYKYQPEQDSIACVIANKNLSNVDTSIIAISIRGGGYKAEWAGNFNVGNTEADHNGFRVAANKVLDDLGDYLKDESIVLCNNVKFWITGYSRSAAVANLVAKSLNDSCRTKIIRTTGNHMVSMESMNYEAKDIFAYCFETPRNTRDSFAKDQKFSHIFNILNRIDPVPRVAPLQWGFTRYGVDCFLPAKETMGKEYDDLIKKVKNSYNEIAENGSYNEDFKYYKVSLLSANMVSVSNEVSQGVFLDRLIQLISSEIIPSGMVFVRDYQNTVMSLIYKAYTNGFVSSDGEKNENLISLFVEFISKYLAEHLSIAEVAFNRSLKPVLIPGIVAFREKYQVNLTNEEIYSTVDLFDKALGPLVTNLSTLLTVINNGENLIVPHKTETTLAWLRALDGKYANANKELIRILTAGEKSYRIATINCPVNVRVYDANDDLRGEIIEDEVQNVGDYGLSVYINDDGEKCFVLPDCEEFRFEIEAYDEGTVSMSFADYNFALEEKTESENYYGIPIQKGTELTATLDEKSDEGVVADATVFDESNDVMEASETINYDQSEMHTVSISSDTESCAVLGGGKYYTGDFSQVTAIPAESYVFTGWYSNNDLVSSEHQYRFRVDSDVTLTAKFKKHEHVYESVVTTEPGCETSGVRTYTCVDGDDTYTEPIPPLGHIDADNDGHCDTCDEMMQGGDHCVYCGKIHGGAFGWLVRFFHKIFALFKR